MLYLEQFQKVSVCLLVTELSSYLANQVPECHVSCRRHLFPFAALLYKDRSVFMKNYSLISVDLV